MNDKTQPWESVRRRWQPDSHVWDGLDSIPIETARNEVLDLCDGIDAMRQRAEAAETKCDIAYGEATRANARENDAIKRAEAAEAKVMELRLDLGATVEQANKAAMELAAVPVDEITFLWRSAPRNSASQRACMRVGDWLQSFRK